MKYKDNERYHFIFLDHATGTRDSIVCEVMGIIESQDEDKLVVAHWNILNADELTTKFNREITVIIKGAIKWSKRIPQPPRRILDPYHQKDK